MRKFRSWLEAITVFGQQAETGEKVDAIARNYYKDKFHYTDDQIDRLMQAVDVDDLKNPEFASLPQWNPLKDEYAAKVDYTLAKFIPDAVMRRHIFDLATKDDLLAKRFQPLFRPGLTNKEVERFLQDIDDWGLLHHIRPQKPQPVTPQVQMGDPQVKPVGAKVSKTIAIN